MAYSHITKEERFKIQVWLETGMSQKDIAGRLGKDKSSLSREININTNPAGNVNGDMTHCLYIPRMIRGGHLVQTGKVETGCRPESFRIS